MGALQFFVQWLALHTLFDPRFHPSRTQAPPRNNILRGWGQGGQQETAAQDAVSVPAGYYDSPPPPQLVDACNQLVAEHLAQASDAEVETYLPQFVSMVVEAGCGSVAGAERVWSLERFLLDRCRANPQLGMRFCWLLRAQCGRGEVLRQNPLLASPSQRRAYALLAAYQDGTLYGDPATMPESLRAMRSGYISDFDDFVRTLTHMSFELRTLTPPMREAHFRALLDTLNARLLRRIQSRGQTMNVGSGQREPSQALAWVLECGLLEDLGFGFDEAADSAETTVDSRTAGERRDEILGFALHLPGVSVAPEPPLAPGRARRPRPEGVRDAPLRRVLRIVPTESQILHSATRTPLLLVCETVPAKASAEDLSLYCRPSLGLGYTVQDLLQGRHFPEDLVARRGARRGRGAAAAAVDLGADRGAARIGARGGETLSAPPDPSLAAFEALEPSITKVFGESLKMREDRVRQHSAFSRIPGWGLRSIIVKAGEDLRQEQLAQQMMLLAKEAFAEDGVGIQLHPYHIICTSSEAGIVEVVPDAASIDQLKKRAAAEGRDLRSIYIEAFGPPYSPTFKLAQLEFARSLAGYSVLSYVLGVKDRHNANLLVDRYGRLIHIDFGFMLGNHPGAVMWETAPFKMTQEYVELLGGVGSEAFQEFERLLIHGMFAMKRRASAIVALLQLGLGAAYKGGMAVREVAQRLGVLESERDVLELLARSVGAPRTKQYDWYQFYTNGILP